MRLIFIVTALICFSCKGQEGKSIGESKSESINTELIGVWESDTSDEATKNSLGNVTMTFTNTGELVYDINEGDRIQRMNMIYQVNGDVIISDQPSHPQKQKTTYIFETKDRLILKFDGMTTVFNRKK
jgi:hypothetical protein